MYIVTGGCGFIGSNIARALISRGEEVTIVDRLTEEKVRNVADLPILRYVDKEDFFSNLHYELSDPKLQGVFHQGACADTTCTDYR